jgi:ABC-2 type transport system permease protein
MTSMATPAHDEHSGAGALQALRAEASKLRSVRSTTWSLLLLLGVAVLFSAFAAWESETMGGSPGQPGDNDLVLDTLAGVWFGQIAAAVLAILAITSEHSTRMIRTTFAANPRRRTVLAAKALTVTATVAAAGLLTSVACFCVGRTILRGNGFTYENGYPAPTLLDGDVARAILLTTAYLAALAVFSLSIGSIVRHTAGSITIVLAVILAPVIAIGFLPEGLSERVEQSSLMAAGLAMQQTVERPDNIPLEPWQGLAVVSAYALGSLLAALALVGRRDV